jgi:thioredoxin-like negative regulator of GroEL
MLERLAVLLAMGALIALAVVLVRAHNGRRIRQLLVTSSDTLFWDTLGEAPDGRPTLVTFSTPSCAACHRAQAPAVRVVEQRLGVSEVRVIRVDAARRPEIARAFGVRTVPSTVVLAPAGRVVAVNQGFAPSARLVDQLQHA